MIGIIDCGGANLNSIKYSLERIGKKSFVSNIKSELSNADSLILPGVGSAGIIMKSLRKNKLLYRCKYVNNNKKQNVNNTLQIIHCKICNLFLATIVEYVVYYNACASLLISGKINKSTIY